MNGIRNKIEEAECRLMNKKSKLDINASYLNSLGLHEVKLRTYQVEGVQWLINHFEMSLGCILADEMGLGKTCQTIAFLVHVHGCKPTRKISLILAPLSVICNWKNELTRFAPKLKYMTYIGNQEERASLQAEISNGADVNIVLTSYELCLRDEEYLRGLDWNVLVVDEAHRLKNHNSVLHQSLLKFDFDHRVLLTGTPIQNNLQELYALLSFISSTIFKERYADDFINCFKNVCEVSTGQSAELSAVLRPFILRRIKSDVLNDLPKKSEIILYHGLSALQKRYYKAILSKDIGAFDTFGKPNKTRLANVLMQLRKCVAHPYLFDGVEPEPFELGDHLIEASGKLTVIDQLLTYLKDTGHKVLLFSQMTRVLDIIQDYLGYRGFTYERLDGSVRAEERFLAVQNFNRDAETFVFLLSTRAGGQGLNLTSADTVIFVDSDFNPQNDLQAAARAHRIGQLRNVKIIRLITRCTVEEIILRRAEDKLRLTNAVIVPGQSGSRGVNNDNDELFKIEDIIKFGIDKLFENEDSSLEDIDFTAILGPTVDGVWQQDVVVKPAESVRNKFTEDESTDEENDEEGHSTKTIAVESMYVFEGTDYSKEPSAADCKVFQQLLDAEKAKISQASEEGRSTRNKQNFHLTEGMFTELPTKARKPRKQLTPEELEQRRIKRAEAAAKRAKEEEEEEVRRAQHRKQKREAFWKSNAYETCTVEIHSDEEGSDVESLEDVDEEEEVSRTINYVVGDVTHPDKSGDADAIVVHCVDNSGRWGKGGLFTSIDCRSRQPQRQYNLAGKMKDLALGDLHLVPIDDVQSRSSGRDFLGLIVAQSRDERNNLSGIKLAALRRAFEKLYRIAKTKKATVHLPRLGHKTPGFNWYGTERLIRKCLTSRGIPTYVYYYPRKQTTKRKNESTESGSNSKVHCAAASVPEPVGDDDSSSGDHLSNIMKGVAVYFSGISEETLKQAKRYIIAYDGDVHDELRKDTTHVIVESKDQVSEIEIARINSISPDAKIVLAEWVFDCVRKQRKVSLDNFIVRSSLVIVNAEASTSTVAP